MFILNKTPKHLRVTAFERSVAKQLTRFYGAQVQVSLVSNSKKPFHKFNDVAYKRKPTQNVKAYGIVIRKKVANQWYYWGQIVLELISQNAKAGITEMDSTSNFFLMLFRETIRNSETSPTVVLKEVSKAINCTMVNH